MLNELTDHVRPYAMIERGILPDKAHQGQAIVFPRFANVSDKKNIP